VLWATTAGAQTPAPDTGLALEDALRTALRENPNIRIAERQADSERGSLVAAGDAFDPKVQTSFGRNRYNSLQPDAALLDAPWLDVSQTQYNISLTRQLRRGVLIAPELAVARTALPSLSIQPTSQATAKLSVVVPLLRDRGGFVTGAPERAAARGYEASRSQTEHVTAQVVLTAATAYWDYRVAD
jgi:outer membrane protein TolC